MVCQASIRNLQNICPSPVGDREVNKSATACPGQGHSPGAWESQGEFCRGTGPRQMKWIPIGRVQGKDS